MQITFQYYCENTLALEDHLKISQDYFVPRTYFINCVIMSLATSIII